MNERITLPTDLSRYRGFIFDCDGTLAETMPAHFVAWKRALLAGGARFEFTWELFVSRAGMSMERTVMELGAQFDQEIDPHVVARAQREAFSELRSEVEPVAEVLSFARKIAQTAPVSVASGSSRASVDATLRQIRALDLFEIIVTPEDVRNGKPHPEMFHLAAAKMGIPSSECLVFEDGTLGVEAARRAGMDWVFVSEPPTI